MTAALEAHVKLAAEAVEAGAFDAWLAAHVGSALCSAAAALRLSRCAAAPPLCTAVTGLCAAAATLPDPAAGDALSWCASEAARAARPVLSDAEADPEVRRATASCLGRICGALLASPHLRRSRDGAVALEDALLPRDERPERAAGGCEGAESAADEGRGSSGCGSEMGHLAKVAVVEALAGALGAGGSDLDACHVARAVRVGGQVRRGCDEGTASMSGGGGGLGEALLERVGGAGATDVWWIEGAEGERMGESISGRLVHVCPSPRLLRT